MQGGARIHANSNHHHHDDLSGSDFEELLMTTASISTLRVQKLDPAFVASWRIATQLATEDIKVFKKIERQEGDQCLAPYTVSEGVFHSKKGLIIPNDEAITTEILENKQDPIIARHLGVDKTIELVQWKFHWPQMVPWITDYVGSDDNCKYNESVRDKK